MSVYRPLPEHPHLDALDPGLLAAVADGGARLTVEQAMGVFRGLPTAELGRLADARCRSIHGPSVRTFIIDRNINYTNVCNARCTFCAFRRDPGDHDAYTLTTTQVHAKIAELVKIGGTQVLMQGGMNPDLPLDFYLDLLSSIRSAFPGVHVHAFSPPEMIEFVHFFKPPGATLFEKVRWVLSRLREAGLDSLPGGGGEIFADPVRRKIGLGKCDAQAWLTVMAAAHDLGMFTSATMMFGHIEGYADRVHHMMLVRARQDAALAAGRGHYVSFISWPFQRENTPLGRVKDWGRDEAEWEREFPGDTVARAFDWGRNPEADYRTLGEDAREFGRRVRMSGSTDYLRTQALSRLFLDNIYSIGSSWVTMGPHVGQAGLAFGANDMGSVMMEENVVSSAGTTYCLDEAVLCRLIRGAGFVPAQRNNTYDVLRLHDGPDAPDLCVTDWSAHRARSMHQQAPKPRASARLTVGATDR
ncbi:MAG: radical SAM protein [Phycisphaeraceae bacterium]|nr:MAG: radical SAM protein [Phycisphaeraceae bacterium]